MHAYAGQSKPFMKINSGQKGLDLEKWEMREAVRQHCHRHLNPGSNPIPRTTDQFSASGDLVNFAKWLKKKVVRGRKLCEQTITGKVRILKQLAKRVNPWDADAVSEYVDNANWTKLRKNLVLYAYQDWGNFKGFSFKFQKYPEERKLPYIPTEQQIDQRARSF